MKYYLCVTYFMIIFLVKGSVSEYNAFRCDYTYVQGANGYFKYHYIPATWQDARQRCEDEGAVLASPYPGQIRDALLDQMWNRRLTQPVFTGIHSTYAKETYTTVNGVQIGYIPKQWMYNEPDNYQNSESCIVLDSHGLLADKKCSDVYTYFCYKEKKANDIDIHQTTCGTTDTAYTYSSVTNSCYKVHTRSRSWANAYQACYAEGGYLTIINSPQEAQAIATLLANYPESSITGYYQKNIAWIGTDDMLFEGDWRTINYQTLKEAGYDTFSPGEPNNYGTNGEQCGCVFRSGLLCDYGCYANIAFICEKNPTTLLQCSINE